MRVDETLMQTLACQISCNSCSRLTRTWELMKLSCKLSLVNSHATLVLVWPFDFFMRVDETLMQLFFSFVQDTRIDETLMQTLACQLSCNSCSRLTRTWELMKLSCKLSLVATVVQLLFSFDQDMRVDETLMQTLACGNSRATLVLICQDMRVDETLMQTLACQLSCNSCSRLPRTRELMKLSCKLSLVATLVQLLFSFVRTWELMKLSCKLSFVNSHTTLVLVCPGHESWRNSHANSRLWQLSCNSCLTCTIRCLSKYGPFSVQINLPVSIAAEEHCKYWEIWIRTVATITSNAHTLRATRNLSVLRRLQWKTRGRWKKSVIRLLHWIALSVLNCSPQKSSKGYLLLIQCYYRMELKLNKLYLY